MSSKLYCAFSRCPPVIRIPNCSSVASGETISTILPSYITAMRSERERISSNSAETSKTALPASRCSMIRRWMNSIAPISTPRVGWAAIRAVGLAENSRAMMTFCWLPPESERAGASIEGVRTSNSAISLLAHAAMLRSKSTKPAQDQVVFDGICQHETAASAIFRNVGQAYTPLFTRIHEGYISRHTNHLSIFDLGNSDLPSGDLTHAR